MMSTLPIKFRSKTKKSKMASSLDRAKLSLGKRSFSTTENPEMCACTTYTCGYEGSPCQKHYSSRVLASLHSSLYSTQHSLPYLSLSRGTIICKGPFFFYLLALRERILPH